MVLLILGAAAFGYLTFGSHVTADIMLSYDASRPEVIIGILALALKTVSTYPILLFCGREAMRTALNDFMTLVKPSSTEAEESSASSQDDNIKQRVIGKYYRKLILVRPFSRSRLWTDCEYRIRLQSIVII